MSKDTRLVNGQELRCGYTTGTTAAAASVGALEWLITGEMPKAADVRLPSGDIARLDLYPVSRDEKNAISYAIKDGGDDADITTGARIMAKVGFREGTSGKDGNSIDILGGKGVGKITQPGLRCKVGEPAINPVPRKMIGENIRQLLKRHKVKRDVYVEISVPDGEDLAKKTFNPRLGIVGGISILGTTGIVEPMSEKALVDTIKTEIDSKYEKNSKLILITPGNYGSDFCKEYLGLDIEQGVQISNFVGEALDYIKYKGFKKILFVGHTGKLVKLAGGIMNTHSLYADCRMELIALYSMLNGASMEQAEEILTCVTTDKVFDVINAYPLAKNVKDKLMERALFHLMHRLRGTGIEIEVIMFTGNRENIIESSGARRLVEQLQEER